MERKLVTIQRIAALTPIEGADFIERAQILGWYLIAKKGEFQVGELACFFEIDCVLPEAPWSTFLKGKNRIKSKRMKGVLSQGLALPLSILPEGVYLEGDEVTEILGVTKFEPDPPVYSGRGNIAGHFPSGVPKTDEIRLQSIPDVLKEFEGRKFVATEKCDGMSATFLVRDGQLIIASRNYTLKEAEGPFKAVVERYNLSSLPEGFVIQGELCGPGIQKNRLGLGAPALLVFNVFNLRKGEYLGFGEALDFCFANNLDTVPTLFSGEFNESMNLDFWLNAAEGVYFGTKNRREGIVVRPRETTYSPTLGGRLSFKVISNSYLLKDEE